jgi:Mce-associated membrane protein
MARTEQAAKGLLTGKAVQQYDTMLAAVRAQAPKQKLILTTTVTGSGVEMLEGDRARLVIFADQRSTRTVTKDTTYAAAMLAVDAVRHGGTWKISNIDTLTVPR